VETRPEFKAVLRIIALWRSEVVEQCGSERKSSEKKKVLGRRRRSY